MKREIKFRAWDKKNKKLLGVVSMSHGARNWHVKIEEVSRFSEGKTSDGYNMYPISQWEVLENDNILTQFTGFLDKNGKDIYFGDILNFENITKKILINGAIVAETINGGAGILDQNEYVISEFWEDKSVFSLKVIGNIFENPELLINTQTNVT